MSSGDGLYGGIFITSMYSAAFFETDPVRVVEAGLAALPRGSGYAAVIRDVLAWHKANPADWRADLAAHPRHVGQGRCLSGRRASSLQYRCAAQRRLRRAGAALWQRRFRQDDRGRHTGGAGLRLQPLERCRHPGRDDRLRSHPRRVETRHPRDRGAQVSRSPSYSFNDIVMSTTRRAEAVIERAGGRVEGDALLVPRADRSSAGTRAVGHGCGGSDRSGRRSCVAVAGRVEAVSVATGQDDEAGQDDARCRVRPRRSPSPARR